MALAVERNCSQPFCELEFLGNRLVIDTSGSLFWPQEQLLVVSDLHLEKGSSLAAGRGMLIPPYDTVETLSRLSHSIHAWQPKRVISLGDSFHDVEGALRLSPQDQETLAELMKGRDWVWIYGNHDPLPPKDMGGSCCGSLHVGDLHFIHEPVHGGAAGEISGHLHPKAKIRRRGKSVRRRCFAGDDCRLILPAFGAYTGGLNLKDPAFEGLFNTARLTAWMLGMQAVYPIESRHLIY